MLCSIGGLHTERYSALVAGVSNRYTPNRIVYLAALLDDTRQRIEPHTGMYRYCDTGMARLTSIINQVFHTLQPGREGWDSAVAGSKAWVAAHPADVRLSQLLPPSGHNKVRLGTHKEIDGQNTLR